MQNAQVGQEKHDDLASAAFELIKRGAPSLRHSRGTLLDHLLGTFNILSSWNQPDAVRYAGMFHSVYSTDAFVAPLFDVSERAHVQEIIGHDAEKIVYLFCSIRRAELFEALRLGPDLSRPFLLKSRWNVEPLALFPSDIANLLVVYMANAAEQTCQPTGAPKPWLAQAAETAIWIRRFAESTPPVFNNCISSFRAEDERRLMKAYEVLVEAGLQEPGSNVELAMAAEIGPDTPVAEPGIWLALHYFAREDYENATKFALLANSILATWSVSWDKRLSALQWHSIAAMLFSGHLHDSVRRSETASKVRDLLAEDACPPDHLYARLHAIGMLAESRDSGAITNRLPTISSDDVPARSEPEQALPPRFAAYVARLRDPSNIGTMGAYPGLASRPWHNPAQFTLAVELEDAAAVIAAEFRGVDLEQLRPEREKIGRTGSWDIFMLFERGKRNEDNCRACPATTRIVESHRTIQGMAGAVYFSRLAAGTKLAPHTGPTNMRLRCHLGIDIPEACGLSVGNVPGRWQEGKCLVFDDSFVHDAWNFSDRPRIVLIADIWHPDLCEDEVALLHGLHRYVETHARGLSKYWYTNERKRPEDASG